ncbi:MAG: tetratricopeptide repeat protein [PVC group bacterium]
MITWASILAGVLLLLPIPADAGGRFPDERWRELIEEASGRGDYAAALDYLSRLELGQSENASLRQARIRLLNGLGGSYYRERDLSRARDTFLEVLDRDPGNFTALRMLGEIAYYSQRLEDAVRYWEEALSLQPDDSRLAGMLEQLKKEASIEERLDASSLATFDIRFHSRDPDYHVSDIQSFLLEAYQEIGYDFNYYPTRPIVVLLYTGEEFSQIRHTPRWVGALYDGKIRLPAGGKGLDAADIKKILWHEYTHALINDRTGNTCPRWLHEGLAQYEEAKVVPPAIRLDEELMPLSLLEGALGFDRDPGSVTVAYAQAYSLVDYLIRQYGFWRINVILDELKKGREWRNVFEDELLIPVSKLEKEWREAR